MCQLYLNFKEDEKTKIFQKSYNIILKEKKVLNNRKHEDRTEKKKPKKTSMKFGPDIHEILAPYRFLWEQGRVQKVH